MCLLAPPVACGVQGALVVDRHRRRRDVRSEGPGGDAMLPAREAMGLRRPARGARPEVTGEGAAAE
jgi:hypothetical protein